MPRLAFETLGDPTHPAIMMLHGFMSCNAQWMPNIDALSRAHYLVMVELLGHGQSPATNNAEDYSIAAYLREFEQIREALGVDAWHLVGQSYGAGLVLHYAHGFPRRCKAIVVTNSRSAFGRVERQQRSQVAAPTSEDFDPRRLPFHPIHARRVPETVKAAMVASADAMSAAAIRLSGELGAELSASHLLGELESSLLVVNGIHEKAFQVDLDKILVRYPNLKVASIRGGHSVNIDAADAFNRTVLEFLDTFEDNMQER